MSKSKTARKNSGQAQVQTKHPRGKRYLVLVNGRKRVLKWEDELS